MNVNHAGMDLLFGSPQVLGAIPGRQVMSFSMPGLMIH